MAPWGAFSNHLRWLLLLEERYVFQVDTNWTKNIYNNLAGPDWPPYTWFTHLPQWVQDECINDHNIQSNVILDCTGTPAQKASAILEHVYPETRTWHNWLIYEHKFKIDLPGIVCEHEYVPQQIPHIAIIADPELAYSSYVKFNSQLNCLSQEEFKGMVYNFNRQQKEKTCLLVDASELYKPELDRDLYNRIIVHCDFADNYELANELHKAWYKIHWQAGVDMVNDLISMYDLRKSDISVLNDV